jgi:hypothetical protein
MQQVRSPVNTLAAIGLALGAVLGLAGTLTTQPNAQAVLWAIDACGLVMACALLALKFHKTGSEIVAGGFLVFAIGEAVILSGTAAGPVASVPSFGAGIALWSTALLLISITKPIPGLDSWLWRHCLHFVLDHGCKDIFGRSRFANGFADAVLRVSPPSDHLYGLDLGAS